jgi:hypothetical protein
MTTKYSKPVARVMPVVIKDGAGGYRPLVVTLTGNMLELRLHRRSKSYFVNLEHAYYGAIKAEIFRNAMEKAKAKKAKSKK